MSIYFLAIFNYKKGTIEINTYTLRLNKNPILTIFDYKKNYRNKYIYINTKQKPHF